jgi:predicted RNA binding protein YcfA (HicA-like mRNA interferase family)
MVKLPVVSGKELIKALAKIGYSPIRQSGSHIQLSCKDKKAITVPLHSEIGKGLLRKIMRDVKLELNDLLNLL